MADYYLLLLFAAGSIAVIASGLYAYVVIHDQPVSSVAVADSGASLRSHALRDAEHPLS